MSVNEKMTAIADAIREKTGESGTLTLDAMAAAIESLEVGGGIDELIDASITEVSSSVTRIKQYAFSYCDALTTADFPLATWTGAYAFQNCENLETVSLPLLVTVNDFAFSGCKKLTEADFPSAKTVNQQAFYQCTALTTANFPLATKVPSKAFYQCTALATVNFPAATSVDKEAFYGCSGLNALEFPAAKSIGDSAFWGCSSLTSLVLRSETVAPLGGTYAFWSTPIKSGTGYVYVPDNLVDSYKAATNWTTYAAQIRPISEYAG